MGILLAIEVEENVRNIKVGFTTNTNVSITIKQNVKVCTNFSRPDGCNKRNTADFIIS